MSGVGSGQCCVQARESGSWSAAGGVDVVDHGLGDVVDVEHVGADVVLGEHVSVVVVGAEVVKIEEQTQGVKCRKRWSWLA